MVSRLTTNQEIAGSKPAVVSYPSFFCLSITALILTLNGFAKSQDQFVFFCIRRPRLRGKGCPKKTSFQLSAKLYQYFFIYTNTSVRVPRRTDVGRTTRTKVIYDSESKKKNGIGKKLRFPNKDRILEDFIYDTFIQSEIDGRRRNGADK